MAKTTLFRWLYQSAIPTVMLLVCLSYNTGNQSPDDPQKWYAKANHFFELADPTDATDSIALVTFQQVIDALESRHALHDTTLFFSCLKKGILLDVRNKFPEAKEAYL